MKHKIILGTVQLGTTYGINNTTGKPSEKEAFRILDFAQANGLDFLDSADVYGDALAIIGDYHRKSGKKFHLINKFKADGRLLKDKIKECLSVLSIPTLYSYMYHSYADYSSGLFKKELQELKKDCLIAKIGISIYSTEELGLVIKDPEIDLIQLPLNIFDLSREKIDLLQQAKQYGKEIHVRSVFFQGLFLKDPSSLSGNISALKPYLIHLHEMAKGTGNETKKIVFNFAIHKPYVDKVILGVDHLAQLEDNLQLFDPNFNPSLFNSIEVNKAHRHLLNPANWKS